LCEPRVGAVIPARPRPPRRSSDLQPSDVTPLTALKLAEIYTEAGVPDGVFNVLTGSGREVGQWLTEHPQIEKISFTGGTSTGKKDRKSTRLNSSHGKISHAVFCLK